MNRNLLASRGCFASDLFEPNSTSSFMEFYQHLYQKHLISPYIIDAQIRPQGSGGAERDDHHAHAHAERIPQWTHDETKELLAMRAELDQSFAETKRNKQLWEVVSAGLQRKGFQRTPDQCKSKWKNLVTRFKGSEAMEGEEVYRQFPFYEDMRKICSDRMERQRPATDHTKGKGEGQEVQVQEERSKEEREAEEDEKVTGSSSRKKRRRPETKNEASAADEEGVQSALREFARRHLEMETRRLEEAEAREAERRAQEEEWRKEMECLQLERMEMERRWREEEEARRAREEARAERRHAVFMALLDKLAEKCL